MKGFIWYEQPSMDMAVVRVSQIAALEVMEDGLTAIVLISGVALASKDTVHDLHIRMLGAVK